MARTGTFWPRKPTSMDDRSIRLRQSDLGRARLHLLDGDDEASLVKLYRALTGRAPTPEQLAALRADQKK